MFLCLFDYGYYLGYVVVFFATILLNCHETREQTIYQCIPQYSKRLVFLLIMLM